MAPFLPCGHLGNPVTPTEDPPSHFSMPLLESRVYTYMSVCGHVPYVCAYVHPCTFCVCMSVHPCLCAPTCTFLCLHANHPLLPELQL